MLAEVRVSIRLARVTLGLGIATIRARLGSGLAIKLLGLHTNS